MEIFNIIGGIASILGFIISVFAMLFARSATKAANEAKEEFINQRNVVDLNTAVTLLKVIKKMNRKEEWACVVDKYEEVIDVIIEVKESNKGLQDKDIAYLNAAIMALRGIENKIEDLLVDNSFPLNSVEINKIIGIHVDKITELMVKLKYKI